MLWDVLMKAELTHLIIMFMCASEGAIEAARLRGRQWYVFTYDRQKRDNAIGESIVKCQDILERHLKVGK